MIKKRIEVSSTLNKLVGLLKKGSNRKPTPFITPHLQRTEVGDRAEAGGAEETSPGSTVTCRHLGRKAGPFCAHWPQTQGRGNGARGRSCSLNLQPREDVTGKSKSDSTLDLFLLLSLLYPAAFATC